MTSRHLYSGAAVRRDGAAARCAVVRAAVVVTATALSQLIPGAGSVAAAAQPGLARLEVSLWPEYDRPAVLVLYRAQLAPDVQLPATISLPVPAAAGDPHAVAERADDGNLYVVPFSRKVNGPWASITITTRSAALQLEYYAPLEAAATKRRFTFAWPGGIAVGALIVDVQRPRTAGELKVTPAAREKFVGDDGLDYARIDLGPRAAASAAAVEVSYAKADTTLTAGTAGQAPKAPEPGQELPEAKRTSDGNGRNDPDEHNEHNDRGDSAPRGPAASPGSATSAPALSATPSLDGISGAAPAAAGVGSSATAATSASTAATAMPGSTAGQAAPSSGNDVTLWIVIAIIGGLFFVAGLLLGRSRR